VAESVFIAGMFVKYAGEYVELLHRINLDDEAARIEKAIADMEKAVLTHGWDGEWFLRAYDARGNKVGSAECEEGQIFIEPQGFCTLAGIGGREYGLKAMESTRKHLLGEFGVELLHPCYTSYHLELGEISSYPPGFKENGSVFCHNNPWIVCAEAELGRGNEAFDIYRRICPAYLEDRSEIHETEPYCYSQMVTGRASGNPGHAKNSWLTGTASWTFLSISQAILGVYPDYEGLRIRPCIPDELSEYTVTRRFRGAEYRIHVKRTGEKSMTVDGAAAAGDLVPLTDRAVCHVEVTL